MHLTKDEGAGRGGGTGRQAKRRLLCCSRCSCHGKRSGELLLSNVSPAGIIEEQMHQLEAAPGLRRLALACPIAGPGNLASVRHMEESQWRCAGGVVGLLLCKLWQEALQAGGGHGNCS